MSWIDWLITLIPAAFVMFLGIHVRHYILGVSDFLVAGRIGRRYMLTTSDTVAALGLVTVVMYVEIYYTSGFALAFFQTILLPVMVILSLVGLMTYRFRETRAMSIGQFIEMRYNRSLRIFASFLRVFADILANIIMPAIAARFFIAYLDLPVRLNVFGFQIETFFLVVLVTLIMAITMILAGGTMSILITNAVQCVIVMPILCTFIIFVLVKFNWATQISPVLMDRVSGQSFLDPFDIEQLRTFNLFTLLLVPVMQQFLHRVSGLSGSANSAISAHEGKMGSILASWSNAFTVIFYIVVALDIIVVMNHKDFADDAMAIRHNITAKVTEEIATPAERAAILKKVDEIGPIRHEIGKDEKISQKKTLDHPVFEAAHDVFGREDDGAGNTKAAKFQTPFVQMLLPSAMRQILPVGMIGLFCLMIVLFIVSTDDQRIYGSVTTFVQDCIVPFMKAEKLTPERHIKMIKIFSIVVGVIYLFGSYYMSQMEYIKQFVDGAFGVWLGGCGPLFLFGFYSRFGTAAGAWFSLVGGSAVALFGVVVRAKWAAVFYPMLASNGLVEPVGKVLHWISKPFHPWIVWEMGPGSELTCPINGIEFYFLAMVVSIVLYVVVSWITYREPFNLDQMLHRGKYATEGEKQVTSKWTLRNVWGKLIGITPEYSFGDKVIAWGVFIYTYGYKFFLCFVVVVIWNMFGRWNIQNWSDYFLVTSLVIPGIAALVTTFWFAYGGTSDIVRVFKDLKKRRANPEAYMNALDNGMVEGHTSLDDVAKFKNIENVDKKEE
ncbi:MAG: hypothetical protein MJ025_06940 [Victivallaceae bacterium]|nr:hypothetical protein [Victivallaceae bacterium]